MTQLDLFPTAPICRPSDPSTSHEGELFIRAKMTKFQQRMLRAFARPRTANEAARLCHDVHRGSHETYRKRKGELQRMGLIRCVGKRKCGVTGRNAEVFEVVK